MKNKNTNPEDVAKLRQKAEEKLKQQKSQTDSDFSFNEMQKIIHELEVHQIELEMQNEEVVLAKEYAEVAEEKYTELYDFAPSGYLTISKEGEIKNLNLAAADMLGKERLKLINNRFAFFISQDTLSDFNNFIQKVCTSKRKQSCEVILATEGNSPIYVNIEGIISKNEKLCNLTVVDITERKLAEDAHRQSEEKYHLLISSLREGLIQVDNNDCVLFVNQALCDIFGYKEEELIGNLGYEKLILKEDQEVIKAKNKARLQIPEDNYEVRGRKNNGDILWLNIRGSAVKDEEGKVLGSVGLLIDITERKRAEAELIEAKEKAVESEEKYRALYDNAPLSYQSLDENGCFIDINPMWSKTLGYQRAEVIGKWYGDFLHPDYVEHFRKNFPAFKKRGYVSDVQFKLKRKNNTYIHVSFEGCIGYTPDGNFKQTYCVFKDITEQKALENALLKAKEKAEESDRLKSAFLANMSHEIRTPMNGIIGFAELLKEPDLEGDEQQKYIDIIEKSGKRMLNIINDIVDISKIEAGLMELELKESNINEQVEYVYTFFKPEAEAKGIELSFKNTLPEAEATLKTDKEKVYAILTNLVKNALKYTNEGFIEFGYIQKNKKNTVELEFYVKDTGIGIPKDRQATIFDRFIQADIGNRMAYQGAGLGLAISKAYLEMLGGKIWVDSEVGKGSTFYFTLPYNTESLSETTDQQLDTSEKSNDIRKLKILIAEDNEVSELLITNYIKKFGKEILKANTGIEVVEACRDNPDMDLVLMDIQMPEMNGYEATRQIRNFNKDVIIIAQTAFGLTGDREKSIESGCNDYIAKPINKTKLHTLIKKYFGD